MKLSRENTNWVFSEMKTTQKILSPSSLPRPPSLPHRPNTDFDLNSRISPSILLIIIILSIIFFISGLLHLLVRFLLTPSRRDREDYFDNVTALQGQLQQLFHLHDSGVDQSFIDTLPLFHYKSIIGLKNSPFDCAVCLSEFETEDKLRLLPKCSHAFHVDCIDTWLLSHSTCPLCRSCLLSDLSSSPRPSFLLVLESTSDHSSTEIVRHRDSAACVAANDNDDVDVSSAHPQSNSQLGFVGNNDVGSTRVESGRGDQYPDGELGGSVEKVVPFEVKLGKFRSTDNGEGSSGNDSNGDGSHLDERRCFSMGSYEYIMDEETALKVHVSTKKVSTKNRPLPGHRTVMSECGFDPTGRLKFNGSGSMRITEEATEKNVIERESFSVSKIWLRGEKEKHSKVQGKEDSSMVSSSLGRAFSFGLSSQRNPPDAKIESGFEEEIVKRENSESLETKTPSFARRTMLWLGGRQNKVVHSSSPSNV